VSNDPYVVHGPPGTGKTHFLTQQAARAADKYGPDGIQIVSLTRTAAAEIRSRVEGLPDHNCGTLHSRCLRGLGVKRGELTADKDFLDAWNEAHPDYAMGRIAEDPEGAGGMAIDPLADDRAGLESGADLLQVPTYSAISASLRPCGPRRFWNFIVRGRPSSGPRADGTSRT
jgi:hypothetical protein